MPRFLKVLILLGVYALLIGACGDIHEASKPVVAVTPASVTTSTARKVPVLHPEHKDETLIKAQKLWIDTQNKINLWVWNTTLNKNAELASHQTSRRGATGTSVLRAPPASALPTTGDYHSWPDWKLWRAVGLCEQRGSGQYDSNGDGIAWHGSPAGGFPDSAYPGGLGLSRDFWRMFAPEAGVTVTNGALASPGEQIRVARVGSHNGTGMGGWSSWHNGCIQRTEG